MYPIFIPSNRNKSKTYDILSDIAFVVNDENTLSAKNFVQSPSFSDNHLPRKRQWILEYAVEKGFDYFWTIDDDILKIKKPDYESRKLAELDITELARIMEESESYMNSSSSALVFRNEPFWFSMPSLSDRFKFTCPLILWNTKALLSTNKRFSDVQTEEDLYMILHCMCKDMDVINYGNYIASFSYSKGQVDYEKTNHLLQKLPIGTYKIKPLRSKSNRRELGNGNYISFVANKSGIKITNNLDEFF
jgi:hypothetical protein